MAGNFRWTGHFSDLPVPMPGTFLGWISNTDKFILSTKFCGQRLISSADALWSYTILFFLDINLPFSLCRVKLWLGPICNVGNGQELMVANVGDRHTQQGYAHALPEYYWLHVRVIIIIKCNNNLTAQWINYLIIYLPSFIVRC